MLGVEYSDKNKTSSQRDNLLFTHYRPARLHQRLNAEEESHILFILQIIQHPLHTDRRAKHFFFKITKIKMFVLNIRKPLTGFLYLLYITVTPVEDGDSQFECGGNHGSRFTCNKI